MNRRLLFIYGCAAAGLVAGTAWPPPAIPRSELQQPQWELPSKERVSRFSADAFELASGIRWGNETDTALENPSAEWTFAGILHTPPPVALITPGDAPPRHVPPGEQMPDGSVLAEIGEDSITTQSGDCRRVYQLHRRQPISVSEGCPAPDIGSTPGNP